VQPDRLASGCHGPKLEIIPAAADHRRFERVFDQPGIVGVDIGRICAVFTGEIDPKGSEIAGAAGLGAPAPDRDMTGRQRRGFTVREGLPRLPVLLPPYRRDRLPRHRSRPQIHDGT
jgi:hypothetical protein